MPLFHFYALAGVLVVGVAVVVAFEIADYHRREQERELEQWHAARSASSQISRLGAQGKAYGTGLGSARKEDGELRMRSSRIQKQHDLLDDRDPFRLTDDELSLDSPLLPPSRPGLNTEASLLSPSPPPSAPMSRTVSIASSSTGTEELFSTISTPTLVSRPISPMPHGQQQSNAEGWDLISQKLGSRGSSVTSSEDGWEALEENVDWGRASNATLSARNAVAEGARI